MRILYPYRFLVKNILSIIIIKEHFWFWKEKQ